MAAALIAVGPSFQPGSRLGSVQNVHLYQLMARVLHLTAAPNDGALDSVRVLLKP
jgi:hypothetical protein